MRSGLHSYPFLTVSGMWFLLVRLACMGVLTGLWHRLSHSLSWVCLSLFLLRGGGKSRPKTGFHFTVQKRPVPGSSGASLAKRPHLESGNEAHQSGKKSVGGSVSTSSANTKRKGAMGLALLMCCSPQPPIIFICSFSGWYTFQMFKSMEKHYI